jgi:isochorismate synthase
MPNTLRSPRPVCDLLARYRTGDFYFRTPGRALLARGRACTIPAVPAAALPVVVAGRLAEMSARGRSASLVVGPIGFDERTPPALVVPAEVVAPDPGSLAPSLPRPEPPRAVAIRPVPAPATYVQTVERAHQLLAERRLRKVVLARTLEIEASTAVHPRAVLMDLSRRHGGGYVFAADLPRPAGRRSTARTLLGASPELLVARAGTRIVSNPLAGSAARATDGNEDRASALGLLSSVKDRHEHALVVEDLAEKLRPVCRTLVVPAEPSLLATPRMWHLSTRITGELADGRMSALALALLLHPTPAVCGTPTGLARGLITALEPFSRGYYSGLVGWTDASGDGEWAVTLRCAELEGPRVRLFAGAGIVQGSRGEEELRETDAKFRTMLDALGLTGPGEDAAR